MTLHDVLSEAQAVALGWALLHSLWQLTLVGGLLASVNVLLQRRSAQARYVASAAALLVMMALPVITFVVMGRSGAASARMARPAVRGGACAVEGGDSGSPSAETAEGPPALTANAPARRSSRLPAAPLAALHLRERLDAALPVIALAWAVGVAALSLRVLG